MTTPLHFGSKIIVLPRSKFWELPLKEMAKKGQYAGGDWMVEDRVRNQPQGYTTSAYDCNAGGFHNGQELTLFHLLPRHHSAPQNQQRVTAAFQQDLERMKETETPIRGLITGGQECHTHSSLLFEFLYRLMNKIGMPVSVLRGKNYCEITDAYYSVQDDRWLITDDHIDPRRPETTLKERFEHIHIAPGDELYVDGLSRPIEPSDVNQGVLP